MSLSFNSSHRIAFSGDVPQWLLNHCAVSGATIIRSWSSHISFLICGAGAESHWKYQKALKHKIQILRASDYEGVRSDLWTTKYQPRIVTDIIGHGDAKASLLEWLQTWSVESPRKAALLLGPPGIGKTTLAHLMAAFCKYEVVEFNASSERSATALKRVFAEAAVSRHMGSRRLVIMDEVDGISSGDRGGIGALVAIIRSSVFPILCISNTSGPRLRSLTSVCLEIRCTRPLKSVVTKSLMNSVVKAESVPITAKALEELCERNGNDIRQLLNFLQFQSLSVGGVRPAGVGSSVAVAATKDVTHRLDAFSATGRLFSREGSLAEREVLFFVDYSMCPLMIGEAYVAAAGRSGGSVESQLERLCTAADLYGIADILDRRVHRTQAWGLLPSIAMAAAGCARAAGGPAPFQMFPSWLGKMSKTRKHRNLYADMSLRFAAATGGPRESWLLDTRSVLRASLFRGADASGIVDSLMSYGLTRDDMLETMTDTVFADDTEIPVIPTKLKGAISREWTKRTTVGRGLSATAEERDAADDVYDSDDDEIDYDL